MSSRRSSWVLIALLVALFAGWPSAKGLPIDERSAFRAADLALTSNVGIERAIVRTGAAVVAPRLMHAAAAFDASVQPYVACRAAQKQCDQTPLPWTFVAFGWFLIAVQLGSIALLAWIVAGTANAALLAIIVALVCGRLLDFPFAASDHGLALAAHVMMIACVVGAVRFRSVAFALGAGSATGVAVAITPLLLPLFGVVPVIMAATSRGSTARRLSVTSAAVVSAVLVAGLVAIPVGTGQADLSAHSPGAAAHMPATMRRDAMQRTGYTTAPLHAHAAVFAFGLPLIGEPLGTLIAGANAVARLAHAGPGSLRATAHRTHAARFRANGPRTPAAQMRNIYARALAAHPLRFAATTLWLAAALLVSTGGFATLVALGLLPSLCRGITGAEWEALVATTLMWLGLAVCLAAIAAPVAWMGAALVAAPAAIVARVLRTL
ncbi:MAG: hypothetical protein AAFR55_01920 [Pseudomonadota bacterium]